MKKKSVGQAALELQNKQDDKITPTEQMQEQLDTYESNISDCINFNIKRLGNGVEFFVIVITKKEPLMQNVIRNYFFGRETCPTPDYDQIVYKYTNTDDLELIWVIPSKDTCFLFKRDALFVKSEEKKLLKYVLDFADGTLFKLAIKLNGEKEWKNPKKKSP